MQTLVVLAATVVASTIADEPVERPRFERLRQDEDWRLLRDPAQHTHPLDGLKHIQLLEDAVHLSFGADGRLSYELFVGEEYGGVAQDDSGSLLIRTAVHSDLQMGPYFRAFLQL